MSEDEPSLLPEGPSPGQRADAAVKAILRRLCGAMEANEAGVLLGEDPEALHDFRIAVRRTRSALGRLKGVFPPSVARRFAPRFAWLGQITSEPRDFDVYLLGFDELKAGLPPAFQADIEPLRGFLRQHADRAHAGMARQMRGRAYRKLQADWRKFLDAPCPRRPSAPQAAAPVENAAALQIWKLFRRALKQGRAVRPATPAEDIHELRKTCKKLRYLLEFFRPLYPPEEINRPVKQLKKLQDYLGDFQDVHARIAMLRRIGREMRENPAVPTETLLALGVLLAALDERQAALRKAFPGHFQPFADAGNRARFKALFKPGVNYITAKTRVNKTV